MTHTPGPWISHDITDDDDPDCGWWVVELPDGSDATRLRFHVADMEDATGTDLRNADLMAAAPLLLEVCRYMLDLHESGSWGAPPGEYLPLIRVAIAKATGDAR